MNNWKVWIEKLKAKPYSALGLLLLLTLPITLALVFRVQDVRTSAALPDQLEAEDGVISSSGVTKQSDSGASGGQYVRFDSSSNPTPTSPPSTSGQIYGPGIAMDTKSNVRVGPYPQVAASFRASQNGQIVSVGWQLREGDGYSLGDCGIARITIQNADNSGKPLGTVLGSLTYDVPCLFNSGILIRNSFPSNSQPNIEKGKMYAVVWENIHNSPSSNYWSLNKNLAWETKPIVPRDPDHHAWEVSNGSWRPDSKHSIGFDVEYENGKYDGLAYHNTMLNVATTSVVSGSNMLRELFTIEGSNKIVIGIYARISKLSGTSPLMMGIYEDSMLLRSVNVPNSDIVFWDPSTMQRVGYGNKGDWEGGPISPLVLESGKTYYLRLSTKSDTIYHSIGIFHTQDNTTDASGYSLRTRLNSPAFREGTFEKSINGGSSWSKVYSSTPGNMQMYFTLQ